MKFFFFLLLIVAINAKCGLEYYRDYRVGVTRREFCNDMEMYFQCVKAERKVNDYLSSLSNEDLDQLNITYPIDVRCYMSIMCYNRISRKSNTDRIVFCENLDAYHKCETLKNMTMNWDLEVSCEHSVNNYLKELTYYTDYDEDHYYHEGHHISGASTFVPTSFLLCLLYMINLIFII